MTVLRRLADLLREVLQTAFRLLPWPTQTGLRPIGTPGEKSPVLVTGNYDLTVRRVVRALRGVDAWLVVAPSRGINVWCAASGGHLSTHQVVTALKTSGVAEHVTHRRAILPQLAATGVRAVEVAERCGWTIRFGPVRADQIPAYLNGGQKKTEEMRHVRFGALERFEMTAAWAAPASMLIAPLCLLLRPAWCLPLLSLVWALSLAVFYACDKIPSYPRATIGLTAAFGATLAVVTAGGSLLAVSAAPVAAILLTAVLTFDVDGSSPTRSSTQFDSHDWHVELDFNACVGAFRCWEVCPEACFEKDEEHRKVLLPHSDRCIRCGACVVQCPVDALFFQDQDGTRIDPAVIRRFKLNLLGKRVEGRTDDEPTNPEQAASPL
jgi:NAD-dependent dihydropyrimidine dehydrogenase PreA subunit